MSSMTDDELEQALKHDAAARKANGEPPFHTVLPYLEGRQAFVAKQAIYDLMALSKTMVEHAHRAVQDGHVADAEVYLGQIKQVLDLATTADMIGDRAVARTPVGDKQ